MGKECQIELYLYDNSKWYSIFRIIKPISLAIKYNETITVIYDNGNIRKTKHKEFAKKITNTQTKSIECINLLVGRIWLDSCIINDTKFEDAKDFGKQYMKMVEGLRLK